MVTTAKRKKEGEFSSHAINDAIPANGVTAFGVICHFNSATPKSGVNDGSEKKFSRTRQEFSIALFIIRDPSLNAGFRDVARRRKFGSIAAKVAPQGSNKFLLLLGGKGIGSLLDFPKQSHSE
jgi:hypothetical protein